MRPLRRQPNLQHDFEASVAWRTSRLRGAGFSRQLAALLAQDPAYDFHALLDLVDRGCPAELAARIVAPIDEPTQMVIPTHGRNQSGTRP